MSGFDQSSIAVSMPTVVGADAALGGPYKIKPSEAFSGALMTVSGLTGETISVETSPDGYQGAPANPTFYRTDWQGTQQLYSTARTNYMLRSQELDQWFLTGTTAGANAWTAPDGTATGDNLIESATTGAHQAARNFDGVASQSFTYSVFFKLGTRRYIKLALNDGTTFASSVFDTQTGTVFSTQAGTASVVNISDGIYRAIITGTGTTSGSNNGTIYHQMSADGSSVSYTGDGTSYVPLWGGMVERSTVATSYIPTTTASVTVTDYTLANGVITLAQAPIAGAVLSYNNGVLPIPYFIFGTGNGTQVAFAYDGVWGTLSANSGKGNGIWQIDLRGAQAYRLVKSAGAETATVNMTLKRDALQYTNSAGTWSVT